MARTTTNTKAKATKASTTVKSNSSTSSMADEELVGRRISKKFGGKPYDGTIEKFLPKHRLWAIEYDDGDSEEMEWKELKRSMDLFDKIHKKKGDSGTKKKGGGAVVDDMQDMSVSGEPSTSYVKEEPTSTAGKQTKEETKPVKSMNIGLNSFFLEEDNIDEDIVAKQEEDGKIHHMTKALKPPPTTNNKMAATSKNYEMLDPSKRKFGKTNESISVDQEIFARNPCPIPGSKPHHPCAYPNHTKGKGSFGFLIQRLSDRNYAMRALCLQGTGAQYNTYKKPNASYISVVWYPPTNLNDHVNDTRIVDGCHLDLVDPNCGKTYLTGPNLNSAIEKQGQDNVECLFLNGAQSNDGSELDADDIATSIAMCQYTLLCLSLTECKINAKLIDLISSCRKLRGLIIENCQICGEGNSSRPNDFNLANVLRSCQDLRWCFIKSSIFGTECWNCLATEGVCPNLEVLWIDSPLHTMDRTNIARGNHDTIRKALNGRADTLKLCMINPDEKNKSRYVIGGTNKQDRLNGEERSEQSKLLMKHRMNSGGYLNSV